MPKVRGMQGYGLLSQIDGNVVGKAINEWNVDMMVSYGVGWVLHISM